MKRRSSLLSKIAVNVDEGKIIGEIDDVLFSLTEHKILGWRLKKSAVFTAPAFISIEQIHKHGVDVLLCREPQKETPNQTEHVWGNLFCGATVMNRNGHRLGTVEDLLINEECTQVTGILLKHNKYLKMTEEVTLRSKLVIIPVDSVIEEYKTPTEASFWSRMWQD